MRYFLDAEFNGFGGDLISIALAPEDEHMPAFYEVLACASPQPWVAAHILPILHKSPISRAELSHRLRTYLMADAQPVIIADWPEDISHLALLMLPTPGHRLELPRLVLELLDVPLFDSEALSATPHNAFQDASAFRSYILAREREPGRGPDQGAPWSADAG